MSFLGIDLGTSGLRLLLVDDTGNALASVEQHYSTSHPHPGWSEQSPSDWITALEQGVAELKAFSEFSDLKGLAVSGHMHGATLIGEDGKPLRPCILWNDTRSAAEAAQLDANPQFRAISGNIVFPGFTAPKLLWLKTHEPDIFAKISKVVLPAAFLNLYLTGEAVTDISDASGTSWLDVAARDWSEPLLKASGMQPEQMPRLVEGSALAGTLRPELAQCWGVSASVIVAGGAADNAAAACGIGALGEGQGFVSLGTSGVLLLARDRCAPAPETALHSFCHAVPDRWYQMGVMLSATDSLNWFAQITGVSPADMTAALGDTLKPPSKTLFLPYLAGERTPHNDADIRGAFLGLDRSADRNALTQAVLEGVAFGLRGSSDAMRATGAQISQLYAIGGGAASTYWLKVIATVLRTPLLRPKEGAFGAALGAAQLAMLAATGATPEEVITAPQDCEVIEPDLALAAAFDEAYDRFKSAYPAIKPLPL